MRKKTLTKEQYEFSINRYLFNTNKSDNMFDETIQFVTQ